MKQILKDPETGREIWRMTHSGNHDVHTYYDINSWNPQGTRIAFSSIRPEDVLDEKVAHTDKGMLCAMNADGSERECLAEGTSFSVHVGCLPIWSRCGGKIYYLAGGHTCEIDLETRAIRRIEGLTGRALSPDGRFLACQYAPESGRKGVVRVDLADLSREEIVAADALTEIMLDTFNRADRMPDMDEAMLNSPVVANIKWSSDGQALILRLSYGSNGYMQSLFVFRPDGTGLKRLCMATTAFGHHSWHPDGRHVLYCDRNEIGPGRLYYLADREGLGRRAISREHLGSHPLFNPAGTEIIDFGGGAILHLNVDSGESQVVASYTNNLHEGLHPHPSWSPDGTKVIYHSDHTGTSQIYVVPMAARRQRSNESSK